MTSTIHEASWAHARDLARGLGRPLGSETIAVADADRRVAAAPSFALTDLPGFDASAMDGWAVRGPGPWTVVGTVHAGDAPPAPLDSGTAVQIATGAPVPVGTDAVLRTEAGVVAGDTVSGSANPKDIRRAGEECRQGDLLADVGTELSPSLLGLIAAAGHDTVDVTVRPRVTLLLLGDELEQAGIPRPGRVRDALGPQVPAWLKRAGAELGSSTHVPDLHDSLCEALGRADADVLITTGGTAAGPRDHLRAAIAAVGGQLIVDEVMSRPGHPMLLATIGERPLVALPGNPQAAVVALLTLGFPLIDALLGRRDAPLPRAQLVDDISGLGDRVRLIAGNIDASGFRPAAHTGPAMMRGLAASTGYAVIPVGGATAGQWVDWLPLP